MLTGHGRGGKSTGNTFSDLKYATDRGIAVMNLPPARNWVMTDIDSVTSVAFGRARPLERQTSDRTRWFHECGGCMIHSSSTISARSILCRRAAHLLFAPAAITNRSSKRVSIFKSSDNLFSSCRVPPRPRIRSYFRSRKSRKSRVAEAEATSSKYTITRGYSLANRSRTCGMTVNAIASGHATLISPAVGSDKCSMSLMLCFNSSNTRECA